MSDVCSKCGLPKDLCVCAAIAQEKQTIVVKAVKRKFGKLTTLIDGLDNIDFKSIMKQLKEKLACGGTLRNKTIELMGDHRSRAKQMLVELGFDANSINVKQAIE